MCFPSDFISNAVVPPSKPARELVLLPLAKSGNISLGAKLLGCCLPNPLCASIRPSVDPGADAVWVKEGPFGPPKK
jgi:hypothetical protein